jgi:hypothetical protein
MDRTELLAGCTEFWRRERRDSIYRVATRLVEDSHGDLSAIADALTVLLLVWNQAFYRYGDLDPDSIEGFLIENANVLERYRSRRLVECMPSDDSEIAPLFDGFMKASAAKGKKDGVLRHSPASAAKGLHLLAPRFFPLWDFAIARAYGCGWYSSSRAVYSYLRFMRQTGQVLLELAREAPLDKIEQDLCTHSGFPKSLLKFLDEYNYARYTKAWWSPSGSESAARAWSDSHPSGTATV